MCNETRISFMSALCSYSLENRLPVSLFSRIYLFIHSTALFAPLSGLLRAIQKFPRHSEAVGARGIAARFSECFISQSAATISSAHCRVRFSLVKLFYAETEKTFMSRPVSSVQSLTRLQLLKIIVSARNENCDRNPTSLLPSEHVDIHTCINSTSRIIAYVS